MKTDRRFGVLAAVLLAAIVFSLAPQTATAAVSFVQAVGSTDDTPAPTIAQAFTAVNTVGNLIVVAVSWGDNPAPSIRAADTLGNTYLVAVNDFDSGNRQGLAILYAFNIRAGANTVTVTFGTTGGYRRVIVSEYTGVATTAPLDVTAKNQGTSTTAANAVTSTAATTTANGNLIFGVAMDDSGAFGTINAGTGFTRRASLNGMDMATEDLTQAAVGSVAATFTFTRADTYLAQMATFKAATTGGGGNPVVSSLACNPTSLNPGGSTTCTVTLNQPAPSGGSAVTLASNNTAALPVPASVTVPQAASSTTFTATAGTVSSSQTVTLTATLGGSTTATVTVAPALVLQSLAVTPANPSIGVAGVQQFTATGTFTDGSTQNLTTSVTWASSLTAVATISNTSGSQGRATGVAAGTTTISATSGSITGSTVLTVTPPPALSTLAATPANPSIGVAGVQQFTATGTFTDGSTQNLTTSVTWASSLTAVATISNTSGSQGSATGVAAGTTTISATSGSITGSTVLTVTPPPTLSTLAVTPANPSIGVGGTQQFTATGTFSDGSTQNLTTSVTWASSLTGIATISNTSGSQGRATGVATGTTSIGATSGAITGSTVLTVTPGGVPITFVQTAGTSDDSAAGTIAQAFTAANTAGNLIVVAVSWGDNPAPNIRAADTLGNTYLVAVNDFDTGNRQGLAILYAFNIRAGANTVTVTLGTTGGYRRAIVSEYSGIATAAPLDVTAKSQGTSTTAANGATSTAAITTANGDLIFGVTMDDSGNFATINAGTGFTRRASLNGMDIATEDSIQAAAGSVAATFTFSRADRYLAQMAAFKAASTGGGGSPVVSSLVCNPTSLNPGGSTVCTVTLSQPASSGGTSVALASNNTTALPVPASVTVPATATSTTFTATAGTVTTTQTVTLTATLGGSATATVTVAPPSPAVSSLVCNPTSLNPGGSTTCTVTLTQPASSGGSIVTLGSNNTSALPVPASVTVPQTTTSTTFTATAGTVTTSQTVTLTATLGGSTTATVTVTPSGGGGAAVSSLVCNPTTVPSGGTTTCTVTLNQAAPAGGATVGLASDNTTALPVPASVTVPAATTSTTFTPTAGTVTTSQTANLTATLGGSATAAVTVVPSGPRVGSLVCNPESITIGVSTICTVTLNQPAPAGGSTVTLGSSNATALPVPASVTVPVNTNSTTFNTTAGTVATTQTVTLTATLVVSTTETVTVTPTATLTALAVTPANSSIATGGTQQFTATGSFNDGTFQNVTTTVTWSSSATGVATISNTAGSKGLGTAVSTGSTTITATSGAITGSTGLTVTQGGGGGAAITFIQAAGSTDDTSAGTITQAFTSNNLTGDLIVVAVTWGDNAAPNIRAADGQGNTYVVATNDFDSGARQGLAILYAPNVKAGPNTVTVTFGVNGGYRRIIASEYSGVATTSPLDVTAKNRGTSTTAANNVTSTAASTSTSGGLIFGVTMDDSGLFPTISAGTGFTRRATLNGMDIATEDAIQGSAGPVAATFTFSSANVYLAQMAAFKAGSGAGGGGPAISAISCSPSSLTSGQSTTCTVSLTQLAPSGGTTVTLSSSNTPALPVPTSVTVPASSSSTTFNATAGTVSSIQTATVTASLNGAFTNTNVSVASSQAQLKGAWAGPFTWPLVAIHAVLLPNGKVLVWDLVTSQQVWDPATNTFNDVTDTTVSFNYFCAGQTMLGDGRVLVDGGHIDYDIGVTQVHAFNPVTNTWSALAQMSSARWYPTVITLGDGRALAIAGHTTCSSCVASTPEVYNPTSNTWSKLTGAQSSSPTQYAHAFQLPDGRVFVAGSSEELVASKVIDVNANSITTVDPNPREGGSSVMYAPGKVMKAGSVWDDGQANVGATTYVIDMSQGSPTWRQTANMAFARVTHNLTILPDGTVLATGGSGNANVSDPALAVYAAEIWNPTPPETWSTMAAMQNGRMYHATALLLPDGRVLSAGSGRFGGTGPGQDQLNAEIYSPPYLFNGARPTITSAPTAISYASQFTVNTPDAATITKVALIRAGSVTHHFNAGQRYIPLTFSQNSGSLTITAPPNGNTAPPGYYMLFILNSNGVPSIAPIMQVH